VKLQLCVFVGTLAALHRRIPRLQERQHGRILLDPDQAIALGLEAPVHLGVDALKVVRGWIALNLGGRLVSVYHRRAKP